MAEVGRALELAHIVNAEYGLSDRNSYTDEFVKMLFPMTVSEEDDTGYLWYMINPDDWGFKCMSVLSYYLYPDKRTALNFMKLQRKIEGIAKQEKVKYIEQGSHLNPKVNDVLLRLGYKQAVLRKEM
jgi:hypothetical protein